MRECLFSQLSSEVVVLGLEGGDLEDKGFDEVGVGDFVEAIVCDFQVLFGGFDGSD